MLWLAAASLKERGTQSFTIEELLDEAALHFPKADPKRLKFALDDILDPTTPQPTMYFVAKSPGRVRLTAAKDKVRWNHQGWPARDKVSKEFQPLWDLVMPLLGAAPPIATHLQVALDVLETEVGDPTVHYTQSSYREAMLEHLLIGELMRHLWPKTLEVCKPQVDAAGYDLILQSDGVLRHVQLKTSTLTAVTASVNLHVELWKRQGGCVIWTRFDPETLALKEFWWLGESLPTMDELAVAKHTKGNAEGVKALRPSLRVVPKGCFTRLGSVAELVERLFRH